jgi:hypothetical protein
VIAARDIMRRQHPPNRAGGMGVWAYGGNGKKAVTRCRSSWAFPGPTFPYNTLWHRATRNVVPHSACVKRALNGPGTGAKRRAAPGGWEWAQPVAL